jgi:hypothetical protein
MDRVMTDKAFSLEELDAISKFKRHRDNAMRGGGAVWQAIVQTLYHFGEVASLKSGEYGAAIGAYWEASLDGREAEIAIPEDKLSAAVALAVQLRLALEEIQSIRQIFDGIPGPTPPEVEMPIMPPIDVFAEPPADVPIIDLLPE